MDNLRRADAATAQQSRVVESATVLSN